MYSSAHMQNNSKKTPICIMSINSESSSQWGINLQKQNTGIRCVIGIDALN